MEEPAEVPPSPPDPSPHSSAPPDPGASGPLPSQSPISWVPPPRAGPSPELRPVVSPPGHPLYVAYAVAMMLLYVGAAVYGYLLMQGEVAPPEAYSPDLVTLWGVVVLATGASMALVHLVGIIAPKRPWGWAYKLVLICIGLTSCCTWPVTIPLLKRWLKPDMKRYYRMR